MTNLRCKVSIYFLACGEECSGRVSSLPIANLPCCELIFLRCSVFVYKKMVLLAGKFVAWWVSSGLPQLSFSLLLKSMKWRQKLGRPFCEGQIHVRPPPPHIRPRERPCLPHALHLHSHAPHLPQPFFPCRPHGFFHNPTRRRPPPLPISLASPPSRQLRLLPIHAQQGGALLGEEQPASGTTTR
jgi:hypothetical protein